MLVLRVGERKEVVELAKEAGVRGWCMPIRAAVYRLIKPVFAEAFTGAKPICDLRGTFFRSDEPDSEDSIPLRIWIDPAKILNLDLNRIEELDLLVADYAGVFTDMILGGIFPESSNASGEAGKTILFPN